MSELESIEKTAKILAKDLYSVGEEIANALTHGNWCIAWCSSADINDRHVRKNIPIQQESSAL